MIFIYNIDFNFITMIVRIEFLIGFLRKIIYEDILVDLIFF